MISAAFSSVTRTPQPLTDRVPVGTGTRAYSPFSADNTTSQDHIAALESHASTGILWQIVNRTAENVASVRWEMETAPPAEPRPIRVHAALTLLHKPNPFMDGVEFMEITQQHIELTGESFWFCVFNARFRNLGPLEMWPLRPDRVSPVESATNYLDGWVYTQPDGMRLQIPTSNIIQIKRPNPLDPYRGSGPIQSIAPHINAERLAATWNQNFFRNSAMPAGLVTFEDPVGDTELAVFRERWAELHRGVGNSHRVAVLDNGAKFESNAFSMRDMQFTEMSGLSDEKIRLAFGYPKPMLGSTDDVNRANADAADHMYQKWYLAPRVRRIESALNFKLLPMFGETAVRFTHPPLTEEDPGVENERLTTKTTAVRTLIDAGFDPADALVTVGLPAMRTAPKPAAAPPAPARAAAPTRTHPTLFLPAPTAQDDDQGPEPDLTPLQDAWETALAAALAVFTARLYPDIITSLISSIRGVLETLGRAGLTTTPTPSPDDLIELIVDTVETQIQIGVDSVIREAEEQGIRLPDLEADTSTVQDIATTTADVILRDITTSATREALRITPISVTPPPADTINTVAAGVREHLEDLQHTQTERTLGAVLTTAQHTGRVQAVQDNIDDYPTIAFYSSEQLDKNTCSECRQVHRKWLGNTLDQVALTYPTGGYIHCLGGDRCRGQVITRWRPQQTGDDT